jgi:lincosamide nucleotidyltransferase B/F
MPSPALLEARLVEIARALEADGGLGMLALGSAGLETARLDQWSDLDFFLIVKAGTKQRFLENPRWFEAAAPVDWAFQNTSDGFKLLFADGVFGEMAWFEPAELTAIPYSAGRWIWRADGLDEALSRPVNPGTPASKPAGPEWALGELLSCLYVGLGRWNRGEKLSAWRFVQGHCLDRFLELADLKFPSTAPFADFYNRDRRWEARHPELASLLDGFLSGYPSTPKAALSLLGWCETHFEVNAPLAARIRALA